MRRWLNRGINIDQTLKHLWETAKYLRKIKITTIITTLSLDHKVRYLHCCILNQLGLSQQNNFLNKQILMELSVTHTVHPLVTIPLKLQITKSMTQMEQIPIETNVAKVTLNPGKGLSMEKKLFPIPFHGKRVSSASFKIVQLQSSFVVGLCLLTITFSQRHIAKKICVSRIQSFFDSTSSTCWHCSFGKCCSCVRTTWPKLGSACRGVWSGMYHSTSQIQTWYVFVWLCSLHH